MSFSKTRCIDLARAELIHPAFAVTAQFLAVHTVKRRDREPEVAGVVQVEDRADVYFRLEEHEYFLVVPVFVEGENLSLGYARMEARSRVTLSVRSEHVDALEITKAIGLQPTTSWSKGDERRHLDGRHLGWRTFTGWFLCPDGDAPGEADAKISRLLDLIEDVAPQIRQLKSDCAVSLVVGYQGYKDQMWGIELSARNVERLASLGADVDIDLYASGPDLA